MVDRLFVILGAGASRGCAPKTVPTDRAYLPPLVTDLFRPDSPGTTEVLAKYHLAKLAAADLRGLDGSLAIEEVLRRRYRDSDKSLDQRIFRAIPPYLQELLHSVSYRYTQFPQNYESLVTSLLRLDDVVFISLNYDVILDQVLAAVTPMIPSMSWYIEAPRPWSLIKLHGSVNWARSTGVNRRDLFTDPPEDLELEDEIILQPSRELWKIRGFSSPGGGFMHGDLRYPALSVPIGQADELVCPAEHVEFLVAKLEESQPMHLLVVGYSGTDREVMSLVRKSGRGIKTLTVVDRSLEAAEAVIERLGADHGIHAEVVVPFRGDFNAWVESGELESYVTGMAERPF